jgi:hypothetical protein
MFMDARRVASVIRQAGDTRTKGLVPRGRCSLICQASRVGRLLSEGQKTEGNGNVTQHIINSRWRHRLKIHDRQAKARALGSHGAASPVRKMTQAVRSVRDRIDAVVTAKQRRVILSSLGCFEPKEHDSAPRSRRAKVPGTTEGADLLAAIDALDHACLQGSVEEIEATGASLVELWTRAAAAGGTPESE